MEDEKLVLTIAEAAKILRISRSLCYEAARTGQIATLKFGRRLLVPRYALERMLADADHKAPQSRSDRLPEPTNGAT